MRYRGMKEIYSIVAVMIFLLAVFVSVVACTHWQEYDDGIRIFMAVMLCIPIVGLYFVISRLRHPSCYAEIRADGVHVFSRQAGELAFIDWKDVADYRYIKYDIDAPHIPYDLLIFQRSAPFGDQSISMLRKYRTKDIEKIVQYRLDELMEKLYAGTMSAEEFKNLPYLFLASEGKSDKEPTSKLEKLVRARRVACRKTEGGVEEISQEI